MSAPAPSVQQLPVNAAQPVTPEDSRIAAHLFGEGASETAVANHFKQPLISAALVGLMLLPQSDALVEKIYHTDNPYVRILIKVLVAFLLFYITNYWGFMRRKK